MKKSYRTQGHAFRFQLPGGKILTAWAKVRNAKKPVVLNLTAADVQRSIELRGIGNTQTCSMSVCAKRQENAFPHSVEGYIDWFYRTAFVVSRVDHKTGMPSECFVYEHHDKIAKLNDSRGGQEKLLTTLKKQGDRQIKLLPPENRTRPNVGGARKRNLGLRNKPAAKGANLRFAVAQLGGVAQP